LLSISLCSGVLAQTGRQNAQTSNPIVTATTSNGRVRYASLGEVNQTRLQVFSPDGSQVYDSDLRLGNLIDWQLLDQQGQHLTDGSYLFLITVKDFSGSLTQKFGTALLESGQVVLQQTGRDELPPAQALALQANKLSEVLSSVDRIGAVSLSVTPTISNEAAPVIDIVPPARQKTNASLRTPIVENIQGTGSQDRLAKWTDNGGTLGDSLLGETGGGVELRSAVAGTGINPIFINPNNTPGFAALQAYPGPGGGPHVNASFGVVPRGTGVANNRAQLSLFNTDFIADSNNYEFASLRARGTDFVFGTGKAGTGQNRPFMFSAGFLSDNNTNNGQLYLATTGFVGIGTNNPQSRLDVNGDVNVTGNAVISGNIAAKYQDVAEWVQAREPMEAGTVVSLDVRRTNAVTASRHAYDGLIAGVVSAQPGVILGEAKAGNVMVTMSGRVVVRVDAGKYPIRIGDLLVASNTPGVAMRSRPLRVGGKLIHRPGTIIGKALEALPGGEGKILVLVSLQ
jgi:hypothetical protein